MTHGDLAVSEAYDEIRAELIALLMSGDRTHIVVHGLSGTCGLEILMGSVSDILMAIYPGVRTPEAIAAIMADARAIAMDALTEVGEVAGGDRLRTDPLRP